MNVKSAYRKGISGRGAFLPGLGAWAIIYLTAKFLKWIQPPFGKLAAEYALLFSSLLSLKEEDFGSDFVFSETVRPN
jgi:hypothetical protein